VHTWQKLGERKTTQQSFCILGQFCGQKVVNDNQTFPQQIVLGSTEAGSLKK
jgi:hypothetical protein